MSEQGDHAVSSSRNPGAGSGPKARCGGRRKTLEGDREEKLPAGIRREGHKTGEAWARVPVSPKPEAHVLRALTGCLRKAVPWEKTRRAPGYQTPVPPTDGGSASAPYLGKREKYCQEGRRENRKLQFCIGNKEGEMGWGWGNLPRM